MDPIFMLEIVIVAIIIGTQVWVFVKNSQAISKLAALIPSPSQIRVTTETAAGGRQNLKIQQPPNSSPEFHEIATHSNAYLSKNPGAGKFTPLKDIAVARTGSLSEAVEANLPLPLYIGLLCTFTGVIIGLIKIAFVGVTEDAIQGFIGGVLIGMIGSAAGLAMTTRSNFAYKNAKQENDERLEGYLELLRRDVVAQESTPTTAGIEGLREQLAAFHEGFSQYQEYVNQSLGNTVRLFRDLKDAFQQIQAVEQGLQGISRNLQANDNMISRQEDYLKNYAEKAETLSKKFSESLTLVEQKTAQAVDQNISRLDSSSQSAFRKMDQYLASITDPDRKAAAERLSGEMGGLREEVQVLQAKNLETSQQLVQALQQSHQREAALASEIKQLNSAFQTGKGGGFTETFGFRLFAVAGTVASLLAIAGGSIFIFNTYFA